MGYSVLGAYIAKKGGPVNEGRCAKFAGRQPKFYSVTSEACDYGMDSGFYLI